MVASPERDRPLARAVKEVMERAAVGLRWGGGDKIFLKPNLTYPVFKAGVTTRVPFIEAVAQYCLDRGCRVTIGEGPGGYNGFSMKAAFQAHGLDVASRRLGVALVELSDWELELLSVDTGRGRAVDVPVPKALLHEYRALVSLPVPKVHCITGVSLALKNLWGCVADRFRIRFHPFLNEIIAALAVKLPVEAAVLDGLYGLDKNGPMVDGVVRELGWVAASSSCGAHDVAITHLLGFDPNQISHLRYGMRVGVVPFRESIEVETIGVERQQFSLRPNLWNRLAKLTWMHPRLTWLVYLSPFAGVIHWLMYLVRSQPQELSVRGLRGWKDPSDASRGPTGSGL